MDSNETRRAGVTERVLGFFIENPVIAVVLLVLSVLGGLRASPFDLAGSLVPRDPVPVDAIPDTGENQQIVFTEWSGRSPADVEDQITYPLSSALLGVPGVVSLRATSMFGFSSIAVVFAEDAEFYWTRSRLLEKLASLGEGSLPEGVRPVLGPDATALGQVFWYTLEGVDAEGGATEAFGLAELRSLQDWTVRPALQGVEGVAEVASIGGHVAEYQIDVDPAAMLAMGVTLEDLHRAVRGSNLDVGARTLEFNRVEHVVRGLGLLEDVADLERVVVTSRAGDSGPVAVTVGDVATVRRGPGARRGALDRGGREVVGGVVVARYGANPVEVLERVRERVAELAPALPSVDLEDGTRARVQVRPFYDRGGLIAETLGTLRHALLLQLLATVLVVVSAVGSLRAAGLIVGLLPVAVLLTFVAMKGFGVDANVVALAGIAIAVGTLVDMGIVLVENAWTRIEPGQSRAERLTAIRRGTAEVGGAVATAVATTVVGFLPVFALQGAEGKLFGPLAATKTFALIACVAVTLLILPAFLGLLFRPNAQLDAGPGSRLERLWRFPRAVTALLVFLLLTQAWAPLGPEAGFRNLGLCAVLVGGLLLGFWLLLRGYEPLLRRCLAWPRLFLALPATVVALGLLIWLGAGRVLEPLRLERTGLGQALARSFPGLGREFMPRLEEGSFLLMPVTLPHASITEAFDLLQLQDRRIAAIPEVQDVVGKIGRVSSALDPAPISMVETLITYLPEYRSDLGGRPLRFAYDERVDAFERDPEGELVPDRDGRPFRQWRPEIESEDDLWQEIAAAGEVPGMTTASKLQPIETRQIMLQTGLRAPFGVKVSGPDLASIDAGALQIEAALKTVPEIRPATVFADRTSAKPYLELELDRDALVRYGLGVAAVQRAIQMAIGGETLTTTIEGRERYPVRVRYPRELRDDLEGVASVLVGTPGGAQVPLGELVELRSTIGPQAIRSEDTFPVTYVLFDAAPGFAELEVVEAAQAELERLRSTGELELPAGVGYRFAGTFENQVRAAATLRVLLPVALAVIFLLLYLQFRSSVASLIVFSGVFVAWGGGFLLLWLYGQPWFLDLDLFGRSLRDVFQIDTIHLSVAVWVGFLALFGIATDDGVVMTTYLQQSFAKRRPTSESERIEAVVAAAGRRIRPCLMTTATTVLALLPVLSSTGKGASVLVPMAIPSVGGMLVVLLTVFTVPVLYLLAMPRPDAVRT